LLRSSSNKTRPEFYYNCLYNIRYLKLKQNSWKLGRGYCKLHICKTRRFFAHFRAVGPVWGRMTPIPTRLRQEFKRNLLFEKTLDFYSPPRIFRYSYGRALWTLTTKCSLHIKAPTLMQLVTRCENIVHTALKGLKSKK
jgi:hypothetical protein